MTYRSMMPIDLVPIGSIWKHIKTGNKYTIIAITNVAADDEDKWPITVVYKDEKGEVWSRLFFAWANSFEMERA